MAETVSSFMTADHRACDEEFAQMENAVADENWNISVEDSWLKGDTAAGILPAGQISGLVHKVLTAKEIIEEMVSPDQGEI